MKRLAVIQSCYIPWRGFFDLISRCDEYVIYDQVSYSSGHWHNRNKIKTDKGLLWLTIPVVNVRLGQPIEDVEVDLNWAGSHWRTIEQSYCRAPYFVDEAPALKELYDTAGREKRLSVINEMFIVALMRRLKIETKVTRDRTLQLEGKRSARVLSACEAIGATHYLSGPSAQKYMDLSLFQEARISVEWMDYSGYTEYPQLHGSFEGQVSVIDLLFNAGPAAASLLHPARARPNSNDSRDEEIRSKVSFDP